MLVVLLPDRSLPFSANAGLANCKGRYVKCAVLRPVETTTQSEHLVVVTWSGAHSILYSSRVASALMNVR